MIASFAFAIVAAAAVVSAAPPPDSLLPMTFAGMSLAQAEEAGVTLSPDVAASRARVASARAALDHVRLSLLPQGSASFSESPQGGFGATTISAHQTTVGLTENLGDAFAYPAPVSQAAAALRGAGADEAASERQERIAAARAYFGALAAQSIRAAREDAVRLAQAELDAARLRFSAGDAPRIDVVRAQVGLAQADAAAESARAGDENARQALLAETGVTESALGASAPGPPPAVPSLAGDPDAAAAAALRLRPEIASAQAGVDAARSALAASALGVIPPVTVSDGYATGVDGGQHVAGRAVSAQVTVPLPFDSASRIAQARADVDAANATLAGVRRRVSLDAAAAARSLLAADRAAAAVASARDAARRALDAVEIGYRTGASSSLDVAEARATYESAQVDALSAVYDEAIAAATFDVETGR